MRLLPDGTFIHDTPNLPGNIETIYAYVSLDENGEGLCGAFINGFAVALVTARREQAFGDYKAAAQHIAQHSGKEVRLVRFTRAVDGGLDS